MNGKDVLLYNNLLRTGNTMITQVRKLKNLGARDIYYFGFHGMCVHDHFEKLVSSLPIEELIMTNSVFQAHEVTYELYLRIKKLEQYQSLNF